MWPYYLNNMYPNWGSWTITLAVKSSRSQIKRCPRIKLSAKAAEYHVIKQALRFLCVKVNPAAYAAVTPSPQTHAHIWRNTLTHTNQPDSHLSSLSSTHPTWKLSPATWHQSGEEVAVTKTPAFFNEYKICFQQILQHIRNNSKMQLGLKQYAEKGDQCCW